MKRLTMILLVLFTATTLLAGDGKSCDAKHSKSVSLTGTLAQVGEGAEAKTVFRVANSDQTYTVCHKSKASVAKLNDGSTIQIKGKVVACDESEGVELMIDSAKKI